MRPVPFGRYELLRRIDVGGFAEVFEARVRGVMGFEKRVAIKRVLPHISEDRQMVEMFIAEAKIAVQLQHPNVAQIFDLGRVEDSYFIAMEFVEGRDLHAIWKRLGEARAAMPPEAVVYVFDKVCDALHYAHFAQSPDGRPLQIIHRDVSPKNILVSSSGEVKVIDFGLAKATGRGIHTQVGIVKGKLAYMSPEQSRGHELDRRSDVYAVGICMWEMLTGKRLFLRKSDIDTLQAVQIGDTVPPNRVNPAVPPALNAIVMHALTPDRDQRYSTAMALQEDLRAFVEQTGAFYRGSDLRDFLHRLFPPEPVAPVEGDVLGTKPFDLRRARKPSSQPASPQTIRPTALGARPRQPAPGRRRAPRPDSELPPPGLRPPPEPIAAPPSSRTRPLRNPLYSEFEDRPIYGDDDDEDETNVLDPRLFSAPTKPRTVRPPPPPDPSAHDRPTRVVHEDVIADVAFGAAGAPPDDDELDDMWEEHTTQMSPSQIPVIGAELFGLNEEARRDTQVDQLAPTDDTTAAATPPVLDFPMDVVPADPDRHDTDHSGLVAPDAPEDATDPSLHSRYKR